MSRNKQLPVSGICGDCGAGDATWALLNKGLMLCTQCCSIHRSLGSHVSQVKSVHKSTWPVNQKNMFTALYNNVGNNVWEHSLFENGSKLLKKKPNPNDSLQIKADFIKAKHQQCIFAIKQTIDDGMMCLDNELGKQLHASVRTANLETSFRLLALGANPNYFHDEKGTTPLHVAVKHNQPLQLELLLVYGADSTHPDSKGKTPADYAKELIVKDMYHRLIESQYEVSDSFSYYLMLNKPDHQNGVHILIPDNGFLSNSISLQKLQSLSNDLFEELALDVYDEVERRQTEAIWLSCADAIELSAVPFLPVNSNFSTTRNQGRQKLARFSTPELKNLVYDLLVDIQRRQEISIQLCNSEEDPVYDTVASDDDYAFVPSQEDLRMSCSESGSPDKKSPVVEELTKKLEASGSTITTLQSEVDKLRARIENLTSENKQLKRKLHNSVENRRLNGEMEYSSLDTVLLNDKDSVDNRNGNIVDDNFNIEFRVHSKTRPSSMYETRTGNLVKGVKNWQIIKNQQRESDPTRHTCRSVHHSKNKLPITIYTDNITKSVQNLWKALRESNIEDCLPCAEKVKIDTAKLIANLPRELYIDNTKVMLDVLPRLQPECMKYVESFKGGNKELQEQYLSSIREYAYVLVSHTKDIVTKSNNACQ